MTNDEISGAPKRPTRFDDTLPMVAEDANEESIVWKAAKQRVDKEDDRLSRMPPPDEMQPRQPKPDSSSSTREDRPIHEYCSNRLRAQATHDRIVGEATNQCRRLAKEDSIAYPPYYVTPPMNSYYRRLVHKIADKYGLAHESIAGSGAVRKADDYPVRVDKGQDWDTVYREVLEAEKAVLIVAKATNVDIKDSRLREIARKDAASKSPAFRLKQHDYK